MKMIEEKVVSVKVRVPSQQGRLMLALVMVDPEGVVRAVDVDMPRAMLFGEHRHLDMQYLQPAIASIRQRM